MAHETIRDVIVRVSLQQKDAALKVPDFGPWFKEFDRVRKEMDGLNRLPAKSTSAQSVGTPKLDQLLVDAEQAADNYEKSLKEAEQTQKALEKAAKESEKAQVKAAKEAEQAQRDAMKAARDYERAVADLANGDYLDDVSKQVIKIDHSWSRAAASAEEARARQVRLAVDVADKTKAAGEGLFTLARGIAFISSSSDDNYEQMIRRLSQFQGAFDIFKGGTDAIKAAYEATVLLNTANKAAAASELVLATASTASAAAMTRSAAASAAATAAISSTATASVAASTASTLARVAMSAGPWGAAIGIATTLAAGVWYMASGWEETEETSSDALDTMTNKANAAAEAMSRLDAMTERYHNQLDFDSSSFDVATERLSVEERIAKNKERQAKLQEQISKSESLLRNMPFMPDENKAAELDTLNATYAELAQRQKQMAELDRQSLADKARGLDLRRDELQTMKEIVNQSRDEVESLEEKLGRLSSQDYAEFQTLSGKAKGGKLNDQELQRFEQLGGEGVSKFTSNIYQERGRQRGGTDNFLPFDPGVMTREKLGQQQDYVSEQQDTFQRLETSMKQMQTERTVQDAAGADRLIATMKEVFVTKGMWDDLTRRLSAAKQ